MAKKRVKSFEVSKMKSGKKGHAYKVTVHHHDKPPKSGKGMAAAMPRWEPPEEHAHPSKGALKKHVSDLVDNMSVSPEGDDDDVAAEKGMQPNPDVDTEPASDTEE